MAGQATFPELFTVDRKSCLESLPRRSAKDGWRDPREIRHGGLNRPQQPLGVPGTFAATHRSRRQKNQGRNMGDRTHRGFLLTVYLNRAGTPMRARGERTLGRPSTSIRTEGSVPTNQHSTAHPRTAHCRTCPPSMTSPNRIHPTDSKRPPISVLGPALLPSAVASNRRGVHSP